MSGPSLICGIDEVGRGALAGPIVAACALFRSERGVSLGSSPIPNLADSKSFATAEKRERVWESLMRSPHLIDFGIGECSVEEINIKGIDWCNNTIFHRAISCLRMVPDMIFVDGNKPIIGWPTDRQRVEPKADTLYWPVSAASIMAKVIRDRLMGELSKEFPDYCWDSNKGYGAKLHIKALKELGPTEHHRELFIKKILNKEGESSAVI